MPNLNIKIVDYAELDAVRSKIQKRHPPESEGSYKLWKRYHDALWKTAERHGKVGGEADVVFYHGHDWFNELFDGFTLMNASVISTDVLSDLQGVVSKHHRDAILSLGGDLDSPIFGLEILITSSAIYVAWFDNKAVTCRRKLKDAGITI